MAITYSEFQRYSTMYKYALDLNQQLVDAESEGDEVKVAFITDKIVFQSHLMAVALSNILPQQHILQKGN